MNIFDAHGLHAGGPGSGRHPSGWEKQGISLLSRQGVMLTHPVHGSIKLQHPAKSKVGRRVVERVADKSKISLLHMNDGKLVATNSGSRVATNAYLGKYGTSLEEHRL